MITYKLDGIRFDNLEELKENVWLLKQSQMSREEFEKYVEENVVKEEK